MPSAGIGRTVAVSGIPRTTLGSIVVKNPARRVAAKQGCIGDHMRKSLLWAAALAMAPFHGALSGYSANVTGTVSWVKIYNSETIVFELSNQPTHCANRYFVLAPGHTTEKQRDRYYAMLLAARAAAQPISVGYGTAAEDCVDGSVLVHALAL